MGASAPESPPRPAVLIDRDGTIVHDPPPGFLRDPAAITLIDGTAAAIARLNAAGRPVVLVTNQAGISRGLVSEAAYRSVAAKIEQLLAAGGARLDGTYMCPHAPEIDGPCLCRKPGPLLYERAAREHHLDLARSWYVGDRLSDVQPAIRFGGRGILVLTGEGPSHREAAVLNGFPAVADVAAAVEMILESGPA